MKPRREGSPVLSWWTATFVPFRICRPRRLFMRRFLLVSALSIVLFTPAGLAQQAGTDGPYKVLKTAKVGGEGGSDYIYADVVGRRLYIPRGGTRAIPATDTTPATPAVPCLLYTSDAADEEDSV